MHSLFNPLRINGIYTLRTLPAHPQEVLHKRHLVYCVRVLSVGCTRTEVKRSFKANVGGTADIKSTIAIATLYTLPPDDGLQIGPKHVEA
jgi:hypothetical protein